MNINKKVTPGIFIVILSFLFFAGNTPKGNLCALLIHAYNSAESGFTFIRPTLPDSIDYTIPQDSLNYYGLNKGSIYAKRNYASKKFPGKVYTEWVFTAKSAGEIPVNKTPEEIKAMAKVTLSKLAQTYHTGCFSQLKMSEIIEPDRKSDNQLYTVYFYRKEIQIPPGAKKMEITKALTESTFIKFSFEKAFVGDEYYITYQINGVKYKT